jgi:hypothetical protein
VRLDGTLALNIDKMEAKIGSLTLENDFQESALVKAGLLSVKRWSTAVGVRIVVIPIDLHLWNLFHGFEDTLMAYSKELRERAIARLLPPFSASLFSVSEELNIPDQTRTPSRQDSCHVSWFESLKLVS